VINKGIILVGVNKGSGDEKWGVSKLERGIMLDLDYKKVCDISGGKT